MMPNARRINWKRVPPDSALAQLRDRVVAELERAAIEVRLRRLAASGHPVQRGPVQDGQRDSGNRRDDAP